MKLYRVSQIVNDDYDTFDSFVIAAPNSQEAKIVIKFGYDWCDSADQVIVEEIGTAKRGTKTGVILGSFNAG